MLTLAQYLDAKGIKPVTFAKALAARLHKDVSQQNVYRWTRPVDHAEFCVPAPETVAAIALETAGAVPPQVWYQHLIAQPRPRRRAAGGRR